MEGLLDCSGDEFGRSKAGARLARGRRCGQVRGQVRGRTCVRRRGAAAGPQPIQEVSTAGCSGSPPAVVRTETIAEWRESCENPCIKSPELCLL
ncbi:hypothetical protein GCM10009760_14920 [Kitasatospora kazusensis]|uniref:Uncharacterized protein n=1 Tax=Kitasatospora kazusensis TaxID=407974 RepID=A0ABN2Z2U7_9ACTN